MLADGVQNDSEIWRGIVTASENGLLLYQPASSVATLKLGWFDRSGKQLEEIAEPNQYYQVRLSPDDKKLALVVGQPSPTIWIYDLARDSRSRFTFDDKAHSNPVWSRDGNQLAFALSDGGVLDAAIFSKASNGAGEVETTPGPYSGRCGAGCSHRLVAGWPLDDLHPRHHGRWSPRG